jgi:hypothetical protein
MSYKHSRNHRRPFRPAPDPVPGSVENLLRGLKRDLILDADSVYAYNARALNERVLQGKVSRDMRGRIHQWQVFAALRRAKLSVTEAKQLAFA